MEIKEGVVSVKQLNNFIKGVLDNETILKNISVIGEVSGFKISGEHAYFSIKDADAVLACRCFYCKRMDHLPKDGDSVILTGSVNYHIKFGLALMVTKIVPYGKGALMQYYEKLKQQLLEEGLFDAKYKVDIPKFATNICVITSRTGAVLRDIHTTARRKNPYTDISLIDVKVQGEYAPLEIIEALKMADNLHFDTIILARGGGSFEDLLPFYDERVVRAIFEVKTPIISAIGHETDFSLSDFVADYRAPTPTAAAEKAVFDYFEWRDYVYDTIANISDKVHRRFNDKQNTMFTLSKAMISRMISLSEKAEYTVDNYVDKLYQKVCLALDKYAQILGVLAEKLHSNDPLKLIAKGLYKVSKDTELLSDISVIEVGDYIKLSSCQGTIEATVTQITRREETL